MSLVLKTLRLTAPMEAELRHVIGLGSTLGKAVRSAIGQLSEVTIAVPAECDLELLTSFRSGGVCSTSASQAFLTRLIEEYLRDGPGRGVIFEDFLARPGDKCLEATRGAWSQFGESVYHLLLGQVVSRARIESTIRHAWDSVYTLGLLTHAFVPQIPAELTLAELQDAVDHAEALIIGVFDGETFAVVKPVHERI